jgi:hypothetical protein
LLRRRGRECEPGAGEAPELRHRVLQRHHRRHHHLAAATLERRHQGVEHAAVTAFEVKAGTARARHGDGAARFRCVERRVRRPAGEPPLGGLVAFGVVVAHGDEAEEQLSHPRQLLGGGHRGNGARAFLGARAGVLEQAGEGGAMLREGLPHLVRVLLAQVQLRVRGQRAVHHEQHREQHEERLPPQRQAGPGHRRFAVGGGVHDPPSLATPAPAGAARAARGM